MYNLLTILISILSFGARGDGQFDNTAAINQAIAACALRGGGVVEVPQGTFVTGTIELKSHVTLHLQKGAVLMGSADLKRYKPLPKTGDLSRYESGRGNTFSTHRCNREASQDLSDQGKPTAHG